MNHQYVWWIVAFIALSLLWSGVASAHRSGCHAWHSCPSDSGSYVCGDTGHSNYCSGSTYTPTVTSTTPKTTITPPKAPDYSGAFLNEHETREMVKAFIRDFKGYEPSEKEVQSHIDAMRARQKSGKPFAASEFVHDRCKEIASCKR